MARLQGSLMSIYLSDVNLLQIMMATVHDEEAELFAKNEAANKSFRAKEGAILERQAAAAEEVQSCAAVQRSVPCMSWPLQLLSSAKYQLMAVKLFSPMRSWENAVP